jgi:hypothetical protein
MNSEVTDVGESDVFSTTCNTMWKPYPAASVIEYPGPVAAYGFVVPGGNNPSTQQVISAEAARLVFGLGGDMGVAAPWVDPKTMWIRSSSTGTNNILSLAINIKPKEWWGSVLSSASLMQMQIGTLTPPPDVEKTIGILSTDYADQARGNVRMLYFQAAGQLAGFLPDSSPDSKDKQNVRDGHYAAWAPIHLYATASGGGTTLSAAAQAFVNPFLVNNQQLIDATINGGDVPQCAMYVQRTSEMGPLSAYSPNFQCYCHYQYYLDMVTPPGCTACSTSAQCPSSKPACNLGFCETQ